MVVAYHCTLLAVFYKQNNKTAERNTRESLSKFESLGDFVS